MVEPPNVGFTGRVWDAVPGERLARDLTTGPGSVPMARAGVAWAGVAAGLGAAAVEYVQILDTVRQAWRSNEGEAVADKMTALVGWISEAAAAAASNAVKAETQAAAYEIARMTMPDVHEIAAAETLQDGLLTGNLLGGPLLGLAASLESDIDIAKKQAARVMQTYEAATAPLANPWHQPLPPKISSAAALAAERAELQAGRPGLGGATDGTSPFEMPRLAAFDVPDIESAYRSDQLAPEEASTGVEDAVAPVPLHEVPAPGAPLVGAPGATAGALDEEHVARAGLALADTGGVDRLGLDAGFATAPAVLGAAKVVPVAAPVEPTEAG